MMAHSPRPNRRSPRILSIFAVITFISLVLSACDSATPTPTALPVPVAVTLIATPTAVRIEPTATSTPQPTSTPEPPKTATIRLNGPIDKLHPFYATSPSAQAILAAIYVGCVGEDERGQPIALGCEQVPTLANGGAKFIGEGLDRYLEVTFKIRAGWRWTDGTPVTTQDALFAWQTIMSPESNLRDPLTQKVYTMVASDDHTIVVNFMSAAQARAAAQAALSGDVPFEYFAQLGDYGAYAQQETPLADANYWAVLRWLPAHVLREVPIKDQINSAFAAQPLGDGAFELAKVSATNVQLKRAAPKFPLGDAALEGIEFVSGDDFDLRNAPLSLTLPQDYDTASKQDNLIEFDGNTVEQLLLNVDRFPFDDVNVRQALAHAINREQMLKEVNALAPVTTITSALPYDVQKSAALLAEAGWDCSSKPCRKSATNARGVAISQTLEFTLVTSERVPRNIVAQNIQRQLAAVGFGVNVQIVFGLGTQSKLFAPYIDGGILLTRNFDAALYRAPAAELRGTLDCASVPNEQQNDASRGNAGGFCQPEIDQLIAKADEADVVMTPGERDKALRTAEDAIAPLAPVVKLYTPHQFVLNNGLKNLRPSATQPVTWNAWEWK